MNANDPILLIDRNDPAIARITLDRPSKRNALSVALMEEIRDAVRVASEDRACRIIILAGKGPSFCAGLDLHEAAASGTGERSARALAEMYEAICLSPLITIAAAHGAAMGGGAGLLAASDFVVAADNLRIAYPEVKRGLVAALVTCLLRRQISGRMTRELILLGRTISAHEAERLGLVSQVVPFSALDSAANALAKEACGGAPGAIARSKKLLDETADRSIVEALRIALNYHLAARNSAEAAEGIAAFREKREPRWGMRDESGA